MVLYVAITVCVVATWFVRDETLTEEDGIEGVWQLGTFDLLVPIFLIAHPLIFVVPRLCFQRTISKWPGMLVCEGDKAFYSVMFAIVLIGGFNYSGAFKAGIAACLVVARSVTAFRLTALIKVCRSEEGFSVDNFHAYYYGTSRKCPFSPFMFKCERDRAPELLAETQQELAQQS